MSGSDMRLYIAVVFGNNGFNIAVMMRCNKWLIVASVMLSYYNGLHVSAVMLSNQGLTDIAVMLCHNRLFDVSVVVLSHDNGLLVPSRMVLCHMMRLGVAVSDVLSNNGNIVARVMLSDCFMVSRWGQVSMVLTRMVRVSGVMMVGIARCLVVHFLELGYMMLHSMM